MQKHGNRFGTHRVIEPKGVLPQPANKLDNNMDEIYDNEILIDVQTLNIDSASFTDIHNYAKQQAKDPNNEAEVLEEIKKEMFLNVELQGKHRNRRTGSGGMLLGKVEKIGDALKGKIDLKEGDRIATLVSLSLTPLRIDEILEIRADVDQVDIKGKAILFESGIYAKIPDDMPEKLALSALDVAGAPAQTAKLCQYGQNVVVLGAGGKSGMLLGKVEKIGDALKGKIDLKEGDRIATLVSLSLTPLRIDEILEIRADVDQVDIKGKAILFESGIYAKIPDDMPEKLALSALDVAGAPAQTAKLCQYGQNVVVLGAGGKSGMLCCYEAKKRVGVTGKVIGLANSPKSTQRIKDLGFCDVVESVAGMTPVEVYELVYKLTDGKMADTTINCVNVPDCEMTAVLCTKDDGIVYFFSMATSFTKAALGAEGIGADVNMIIGNGYTKGHADFTLQELRECPKLRKIFEELYA